MFFFLRSVGRTGLKIISALKIIVMYLAISLLSDVTLERNAYIITCTIICTCIRYCIYDTQRDANARMRMRYAARRSAIMPLA